MFDDYGLILENKLFHNWKYLFYQFLPDLDQHLGIEQQGSAVYYRPFAHILPMINYLLFGTRVFYYHFFNLLLFILCCLNVYFLVNLLFKQRDLSLLSASLFAVHPLNGLFVNYITASVFGLQILSLSWAAIFFLKFQKEGGPSKTYLAGSLLLYTVACLCHETAFVFPLYLAAILLFVQKSSIIETAKQCLPYLILFFILIILRWQVASLQSSLLNKFAANDVHWANYLASLTKITLWYLSQFILPFDVVIKWAIPLLRANILFWLFISTGLLATAIIAMKNSRSILISWTIAWMLIGFIPVLGGSAFQLHYGVILEPHWLFFPSIAAFTFLAHFILLGCLKLEKITKRANIHLLIPGIIVLLLIAQSRAMNTIWSNAGKYALRWHKISPPLKEPIFYLASWYMQKGETELAQKYFHLAMGNEFSDWEIWNNLALIEMSNQNITTAQTCYEKALTYHPRSAVVYNNLGLFFLNKGKSDTAQWNFEKAIELNPLRLEPRLNLAILHQQKKRFADVENLYLKNLDIDPLHSHTWQAIITLYLEIGATEKALNSAETVLKKNTDEILLTNLGSLFAAHNHFKPANQLFIKSLKINPEYPNTYIEYGKFLANSGHISEAIQLWQAGKNVLNKDSKNQKETFDQLITQASKLLHEKR
jgi:Tfp pilus assembly protein PilF